MKYLVGLILIAAVIAGSYFYWTSQGGGAQSPFSRFVDACIENGDTDETCACTASAMQANLSKENFEKFVDIAEAKDDSAGERFMQDVFAEYPETISGFTTAIGACGSQ